VTNTCPSCGHQWEEEVVVPRWYDVLVACPKPEREVPPYEHCEAWMNDHQGSWELAEEKAGVVENYWNPKKRASPWAMFYTYILGELRLQSEREERIEEARQKTGRNY